MYTQQFDEKIQTFGAIQIIGKSQFKFYVKRQQETGGKP